jgi:hypothetical protein
MPIGVTGDFVPLGSFSVVDGKDVGGNITGSFISASNSITGSNIQLTNIPAGSETTFLTVDGSGNVKTTTSIQFVQQTITDNAIILVDSFAANTFNGAIYDYVLLDAGVGCRTGQFFVTQDNALIDFTDISTKDVGNDAIKPLLSAALVASDVVVSVTNGSGYTFKAIVKKL